MVSRLKFPLAVLSLFLLVALAPLHLYAQAPPDPGQQGEFQGENTDTGAAAVDQPNEKGAPEVETAATAAASASVSAASPHAADLAGSEPPESGTDTDRIEDQVGDQTAADPLTP
jgi:hypothetical protein